MRLVLRRLQSSAGPQPVAVAVMEMEGSQAAAVGVGRNARSGAVPGALSRMRPPWDRGGMAPLRAPRNKSGGERGKGCTGQPGIPSSGLKRDVLQFLEKLPSPPPRGGFPSRSRGRECHVYLNSTNSLFSTYGLPTGDPKCTDKCKISMMLFL